MRITGQLALATLPFLAAVTAHTGQRTPVQQAPERAVHVANPLANEAGASRAGAKLYARECAACHGLAGEGRGKALPLMASEVHAAAPGALFWVLTNGSLRRGMPSFAHVPEAQRWQIVGYLKNQL